MSPRRTRPLLENWGSVSNKQTHKHKLSITFCSICKLYSISRILLLLIKNVIKFLFDGLHLCIFYMCFCVLYGIAVTAACFLCVVLDTELLKIGWSMRRSNKNERDFKNQELHNCNTENKKHRKAREMMLWLVFILNLAESRVTRRAGLWASEVFHPGFDHWGGKSCKLRVVSFPGWDPSLCVEKGGMYASVCRCLFLATDVIVPAAWSGCCLSFSTVVACTLNGDLR